MDRSISRGREALTSSGRGGLGNIRLSSASRDRDSISGPPQRGPGPDDFSDTRGREPTVSPISDIRSTGRGGAGNFRSPSRDVTDNVDVRSPREQEILRAHKDEAHSTGRGGAGNLTRSPSAGVSRERGQQVHSSGRGGAGNFAAGPAPAYERGRAPVAEGIHSTGRGGLANLTSSPPPPQDRVVHQPGEYESSGRGGMGNMSSSRERGAGSRERGSRERVEAHGIAGLWNRLHPPPSTIKEDQDAAKA
ncbi:hypothetical protein FB45DRAFT_929912 [Roridomyces roridus]|uniref:Uncharacterized protein n=1 Tax=Roridomyces roridus TaxID=1738132 RepID=A0AAD7FIA3_9AGAR|nr:hypothetical protein FB45DRAFT_929912 [Roridomyces roridus]